jgi:hypothetical protein
MNYEKFPIYNINNYNIHFNDIKNWFEENAPNFFSKIILNESDNDYGAGASLDLYDKINDVDTIVYTIYTEEFGASTTYNSYCKRLRIKSYINNGNDTHESSIGKEYSSVVNESDVLEVISDGKLYSTPEYYNAIYEITKMRENIIGLTLTNRVKVGADKLSSVLIFAKTHNSRIALIRPTINFSKEGLCKNYKYNNTTGNYINYVSVLTYDTPLGNNHLGYLYGRDGQTVTSFMKLPVVGCDDYIPNVFYLPSTSVRLKPDSECTLHIGNFEYYYNGVIAVELLS